MAEQATEVAATETPSLEDRIADKFLPDEQPAVEAEGATESDEPEAQPEEGEGDEAEPEEISEADDGFVEYELNGAKYRIPQEMKSALEAGSDYTKKTTELANTRRAIEIQHKELSLVQERRKFDASVADDVKNLELIEAYVTNTEQNTDWSKLSTDQIVRARLELDQLRARRDELKNTLGTKWNEFQAKTNAERAKLKQEAAEALSKSIPNWSDETRTAIEKYVIGLGYSEIQAQNMAMQDYVVANKARLYDELQATKASAVQKAKLKDAKVIKPTSRSKPMPDTVRQQFDYRKAMNRAKTPQEKKAILTDRIAQKFGA